MPIAALRHFWKGLQQRVARAQPRKAWRAPLAHIGIAPRLTLAFLAVALLAIAANLLVVRAVLVLRTTEIRRVTSARPAPAPVLAPVSSIAIEPTAVTVATAPTTRIQKDALLLALNRFPQSLESQLQSKTEGPVRDHPAADELDRATADYLAALGKQNTRWIDSVRGGISSYRRHGEQLAALADERHAILRDYATQLEAVRVRVNGSLQGAWKIFGRVVARASLIDLDARLDELRRAFTSLSANDGSDDSTQDSEQPVATLLAENEKTFRRSEGDDWFNTMTQGTARLQSLHKQLLEKRAQTREQETALAQESERLVTGLPRDQDLLPRVVVNHVVPAPVIVAPVATAAPSPAAADDVKVTTQSVTTGAEAVHRQRLLLAWISAAVLLLTLWISVGTVRSIVNPVRRLLKASARIAKGDHDIRVPRGGIFELDTLGMAFNQMAQQLQQSRAVNEVYQLSLETKVSERTQQLQRMADHDPLTGLPNRRRMFELLNTSLAEARTQRHRVGVLFLDVDNFKYINDGMGHAFGDRLLIALATRLAQEAREFGFAARLGGDEFTLIYQGAAESEEIAAAAARVVQSFHVPLSVDGRDLSVSVSVGVGIFPDHGTTGEALLSAADAALFRAKALGRSQWSLFAPELLAAAKSKFSIEQGLRRALERGEFKLVYQPEIHARSLQPTLVEALIRWSVPGGECYGPQEFLAVAEESGLIIEIGDWVLRAAIEAVSQWLRGPWPSARVAINVSVRQLLDPHFVDRVHQLLQQYAVPASAIEIELTESVLQTGRATIDTLQRLRASGVAIALDDFGTGYSSIASLERLPLSRIKLDRSLVDGVDTSTRSSAIARAIIALCEGLGLEVTAEGIERPQQFDALRGHASMYLQGHLLSPAVPAEELIEALRRVEQRAQELLLESSERSGLRRLALHESALLLEVGSAS